jgi:hypothetical protein
LVGELFSGLQFHPNDRYFVGLTPLLRYNFATGSRWAPLIDLGPACRSPTSGSRT